MDSISKIIGAIKNAKPPKKNLVIIIDFNTIDISNDCINDIGIKKIKLYKSHKDLDICSTAHIRKDKVTGYSHSIHFLNKHTRIKLYSCIALIYHDEDDIVKSTGIFMKRKKRDIETSYNYLCTNTYYNISPIVFEKIKHVL